MLWYFVSYGWQRFQLTRKSLTNLIRVCQSLLSNVLGTSKVHRYAFKQQCNLIDCILRLTFMWVANDQYYPEMLFMKTLTHGNGGNPVYLQVTESLCVHNWIPIIVLWSTNTGNKFELKEWFQPSPCRNYSSIKQNFVSKLQTQMTGRSSKRFVTVSFSRIKQKIRQCYFVKFQKLKLNAVESIHVSKFRSDTTIEIH